MKYWRLANSCCIPSSFLYGYCFGCSVSLYIPSSLLPCSLLYVFVLQHVIKLSMTLYKAGFRHVTFSLHPLLKPTASLRTGLISFVIDYQCYSKNCEISFRTSFDVYYQPCSGVAAILRGYRVTRLRKRRNFLIWVRRKRMPYAKWLPRYGNYCKRLYFLTYLFLEQLTLVGAHQQR